MNGFEEFMQRIELAYGSSRRFYHTMAHIRDLMTKRYQWMVAESLSPCEAVLFAIILHDVVYNPQCADNEPASATCAKGWMTWLGHSDDLIAQVGDMILSTMRHEPIRDDFETMMFLDLDLSILGSSHQNYDAYAKQIREEYAFVPDSGYYEGRNRILQRFLDKPQIYMTDYAKGMWEEQARVNLVGEIVMNTIRSNS